MNVNDAVEVASVFESLARRIVNYNKSREDIIEELEFFAKNYRDVADRIDESMYQEYLNDTSYSGA